MFAPESDKIAPEARGPTARADEPVSFGARLRAERERREISIASIAHKTKILGALLEGLENDDVSRWPTGFYRRAFFRAYVVAIGLDPEPAIKEFTERFPEAEEPTLAMVGAQESAPNLAGSSIAATPDIGGGWPIFLGRARDPRDSYPAPRGRIRRLCRQRHRVEPVPRVRRVLGAAGCCSCRPTTSRAFSFSATPQGCACSPECPLRFAQVGERPSVD